MPLSSEYGTYKTAKSRPDSGLGFQVNALNALQVGPSSLGSGNLIYHPGGNPVANLKSIFH